MGVLVKLSSFKHENQYKEYYSENYKAVPWVNESHVMQKTKKRDIEKELRLAYIRILTKKIEKNTHV